MSVFVDMVLCSSGVNGDSSFRLRLVMPPTLFFVLQLPFTQLAYVLFPVAVANGIIAGAFTFCKSG